MDSQTGSKGMSRVIYIQHVGIGQHLLDIHSHILQNFYFKIFTKLRVTNYHFPIVYQIEQYEVPDNQ